MNRIALALAFSEAVLLAVIVWLVLQNQALRRDLEARPAGSSQNTPTPEGDRAGTKENGGAMTELEKSLAEREKKAKEDKANLEKELEAVKKELAEAKNAGKPPEDKGIKSLEDILAKHKQALIYGKDIPEDVIKALGLEQGQAVALKMAMDDELRRMDEAIARFHQANTEGATTEDLAKPAKDLIMKMMGQIGKDMQEFGKLPLSEQMKIHSETSIEEVLGEERFLSKLCREVHATRLQTYKDLERSLTPEQIAKLREEYLREGMLAYDEQFKLEFGSAPKDMKK